MNFVFGPLLWLILWSNIAESWAHHFPGPLRISTRHFPPYMYKNANGTFYDGMEFNFLLRMAEMFNVSLQFHQVESNHSNICYDVALNNTDICIGGIFPTEDILKYASMSVTYATDDLAVCVADAGIMPMVFAHMHSAKSEVWLLAFFGYGYPIGMLLYLLIKFDRKYKRRNDINWHHTTLLVTFPAVVGLSPNFQPVKGTVRLFYAFVLICAFFAFQIIFTRAYDLLHAQRRWYQITTFKEVVDEDFSLAGSSEAFHILSRNKMISERKIEFFTICDDITECLAPDLKNRTIAGSRQNIFNSPSFSPSQVFCFDDLNSITSYPIGFYIRKGFALETKMNAIARQLLEAGYFVKWKNYAQIEQEIEPPYTAPLQLPMSHVSAALIFALGAGHLVATSVFVIETITHMKMKRQQRNRRSIWIYLEQFVDGRRHYFKDEPERLQKRRRR